MTEDWKTTGGPAMTATEREIRMKIGLRNVLATEDGKKEFAFQQYNKVAGKYMLGGQTGLHIWLCKKPRWLTRILMRFLLEWEWSDT